MATGLGVINALMTASGFGFFIRAAAAIAGATAALSMYKDEIIVVEGSMGSLGDYMRQIWADIQSYTETAINGIAAVFGTLGPEWQKVTDNIKSINDIGWSDVRRIAVQEINALVNAGIQLFNELAIHIDSIIGNIAVGMRKIAVGINAIVKWSSVKTPEFPDGKGLESLEKFIDDTKNYDYRTLDQTNMRIDAMRNNLDGVDPGGRMLKYLDDLKVKADAAGKSRLMTSFRQSELATWGQQLGTPDFGKPVKIPAGGGAGETDSKAARKAQKLTSSLEDMNQQISRTYEEIEALQGTEMGLQALNDQFKREDEVRKYARAMEKAGWASDLVKQKSAELMKALEMRDALEKAREALTQWQDTLVGAFDQVSGLLVDAAFDGGESLMKLPDIAKAVAKDIFNTFFQLSLMNPLKNMLFGTNLPTTSGAGFLGGLLGGLGTPAPSAYTFTPGMGLWAKGGISTTPIMKYAAKGMMINSPTKFMTSQGPVMGGEAGAEAILPLGKDAKGRLGVRSSGAGPRGNKVYVSVNNTMAQDANIQVSETENNQGEQMIDITVGRVFKKMAQGDADPFFASAYNLRRSSTRRG